MGSRFMCTVESAIHQKVKEAIVAGTELDTEMIFRPLRNTARVASNAVSREVVEILNNGGQFEDVKDLVAGSRGVKVYEIGDLDIRERQRINEGPNGANCLMCQRAQCERVASDCVGQLLVAVKLLRGIALDQDIAVVERLEVNLDDISTGVVDPHVTERMGHH